MHESLEATVEALDLVGRLPTLSEAAKLSASLIEEGRRFLTEELPREEGVNLDVVAVGSIARREASELSDVDYLVIAYELLPENKVRRTRELLQATDRLLTEKFGLKDPGRQGMFGTVISAPDLTERIGLEGDTNVTHSRRILLLEESVSIYAPDLHASLVRAVLKRYLLDYEEEPKAGVPRFLLNDVERYWRTICVDYQAKRWTLRREGWGLRYLKLIISRKLAFVGTIASLLTCEAATVDYFENEFAMPPLARLGKLHERLGRDGQEALREVFLIAEEFATALKSEEFRDAASDVGSRAEIVKDSEFEAMRRRGRELQSHLETVFFNDPALAGLSRNYLSF
jgi:predicted nucleotidyltransferase